MTIALPFFGGELSAFTPSAGTVIEGTDAGTYDANYSRCSIGFATASTNAVTPTWASTSPFWFHGAYWINPSASPVPNNYALQFYSGATVVARVLITSTNLFVYNATLQTLQSGTLTTVGSAVNFGSGLLQFMDVQIVAGGGGSAALYFGGVLATSGTGLAHGGFTGVTSVTLLAVDSGPGLYLIVRSYWSQIICDTTCTIGRNVWTDNFTNESATNTGWTGAGGGSKLSDINEIALSDTTYILAASSGLADSFYQSGQSFGTYSVLARAASARSLTNGTGPANQYLLLRVSSTNYLSSATTLSSTYGVVYNTWTTNPNTSAAWTAANAAGIETGVQSLT
jgi:hypothetical protein